MESAPFHQQHAGGPAAGQAGIQYHHNASHGHATGSNAASAAPQGSPSTATSATAAFAGDLYTAENWKYVECTKCCEDAVIQRDDGTFSLRADFNLTSCGHIACSPCLQATATSDGGQTCPRCRAPLTDWIPLQSVQSQPSVGLYFRSLESMLAEVHQATQFQVSNLQDRLAYYKNIAKKQSAILKQTKQELIQLRALKKDLEALQRENAALKSQLGMHGQQEARGNPSHVYPHHDEPHRHQQTPQLDDRFVQQGMHHTAVRPVLPSPRPSSAPAPPDYHQQQLHPAHHQQHGRSNGRQSNPPLGLPVTNVAGSKRSADEAGIGLPAKIRESDLPGNAMSSAQNGQHDTRAHQQQPPPPLEAEETSRETLDFLNRFRAGGASTPIPRSASRQSNSRSGAYSSGARRSITRSDLPPIEEDRVPFQRPTSRNMSSGWQPVPQRMQHQTNASDHVAPITNSMYEGQERRYGAPAPALEMPQPTNGFLKGSEVYQNGTGQGQHPQPVEVDGRPRSFRPLVARQGGQEHDSMSQLRPPASNSHHQAVSTHTQVYTHPQQAHSTLQRPFHPTPSRPATAQPGGGALGYGTSGQHYITSGRPSTAQGGRRSSTFGSAAGIRPMAIPPPLPRAAQSSRQDNTFKFQANR